jgi:hypothetical protein
MCVCVRACVCSRQHAACGPPGSELTVIVRVVLVRVCVCARAGQEHAPAKAAVVTESWQQGVDFF